MFQDHFGLHDDPFALGPNLRFLFRSNAHAETMAHLGYGLEQGEDIVMISGAIGTGKTLALHNLQAKVSRLFRQVLVNVTTVNYLERFLKLVLHELGETWSENADAADLLVLLKESALKHHAKGQKILLVVDEAQNLQPETLEGIRLLTNIGQPDKQIFQIILAGQLALEDVVNRPELAQLRQRIRIHYRLEPLSRQETGEYIAHRLAVAGREEQLFTPAAVARIHEYSGGIPRLVNHLAGHSLLAAFVDRSRKVDVGNVASEGMPDAPAPARGGVPSGDPAPEPKPAPAPAPARKPDVVAEPSPPPPPAKPAKPAKPVKPVKPVEKPVAAPTEPPPPLPPEPAAAPESPPSQPSDPSDRLPPAPRRPMMTARDQAHSDDGRRSPVWVWIALAAVVIAVAGWYFLREEGRKRADLQTRSNIPTTRIAEEPVAPPPDQPVQQVEPAATDAALAATPAMGHWLHVASFRDEARANRYRDALTTADVDVAVRGIVLDNGESWLRVVVGPFGDPAAAEVVGQDLERQGLITFHRAVTLAR